MGAGHSGFSLRRAINRRRYFYALIAADPHQTVTHAVNYWVSKGAWGETNGMREQLAQHGWVGAEVIIGSDLRSLALSPIIDAVPGIDLLPSAAPTSVKRTRQACRQKGTRSAPHSILGVLRSGSSPQG